MIRIRIKTKQDDRVWTESNLIGCRIKFSKYPDARGALISKQADGMYLSKSRFEPGAYEALVSRLNNDTSEVYTVIKPNGQEITIKKEPKIT